ncbi:MAG: tRNA preQ1(34) S-adenosylmethionine ribosyltransferase-isomerase QueA [Eubacteriaceae bacterium]|nr:tRNA preQ1(34) S-adenosylmethionine ribosyltransferase-isomerase QueA [Eubacteriaceae bacterium]
MNVNDFDYELPEELIAQKPADKRENSRLMVLDRDSGNIIHDRFYNIADHLDEGDCLVLNDSRVLPARLFGEKEGTGAKIEFLLTKRMEGNKWETMVRPGKRLKPGDRVRFADDFAADIIDNGPDGTRIVEFDYEGIFMERLEHIGAMPLPPYIERPADDEDRERYQTVYSKIDGSVAAPTAGLHFTDELLGKAAAKGVKLAYVTLHVGIGTFRPVKAETVEEHHMHFEEYTVSQETADVINDTKAAGGKIICVGTTSTRTVESAAVDEGEGWKVKPGSGSTDIFIYPGYEFRITDRLITNFHLPKSTLMMLISALYDREKILEAYEEAKKEKYRFFSYGDAMFIK